MSQLTENAERILKQRYYLKNDKGEVIEDWDKLCRRVAKFVASAEKTIELKKEWEEKFYEIINSLEYLPSSPTLFNAGTKDPQLNACFVIDIPDSMEGIFKAVRDSAIIYKSGGGCGFYFGHLRPRESSVAGTGGTASGPISFMEVFDKTVDVVKQGAKRRGAALGCLPVWHPDIEEYIKCKNNKKSFSNFNISVGITDEFMKAVEKDEIFELKHPKSKITKKIKAKQLWNKINKSAHATGDPGILFIDSVNKYNPIPDDEIFCTNPCLLEGTLIQTPNGYFPVESLKIGNTISTTLGSGPVKSIEKHDDINTFEIKMSDGGSLKATKAHIFYVQEKGSISKKTVEKRLDQIKIGDSIMIHPHSEIPNNNLEIKLNNSIRNAGLFIGSMIGDGNYSTNTAKICFGYNEKDWMNNFINSIGDEFKPKVYEDKTTIVINYHKSGLNFLNNVGIKKSKGLDKKIPLELINSNKYLLQGIIDGLISTDGDVNLASNHPQIRLHNISENLVKDVRRILFMFGIHGRITRQKRDTMIIEGRQVNCNDKFTLNISGSDIRKFYNHFNLTHPKKQEKLEQIVKTNLLTGGTRKASVVSIEYYGKGKVYDLYEEKSDTWLAEGYVQRGCGEQPLNSYESCVLGSINLIKFINEDKQNVNYKRLSEVINISTRFLDNTIDLNKYPIPEIENASKANRKIGLGIMGYADMLIELGMKYDSNDSIEFADQLMNFVNSESYKTSVKLGEEKGNFPNFNKSVFNGKKSKHHKKTRFLRNAARTTIAPTGSISVIAGISSGIEPNFSFEYERKSSEGVKLDWIHPLYKKALEKCKGKLTQKLEKIYISAKDIDPDWHIKTQHAFQLHCDSSISKTINLPFRTPIKEVKRIYEKAYTLGLKGITVFRDGCKGEQVLYDKALKCPSCKKFTVEINEGCKTCRKCGWSACSIR